MILDVKLMRLWKIHIFTIYQTFQLVRQPPPLEIMELNPLPYALGNLVAHRYDKRPYNQLILWAIVVPFHIKLVHSRVSYKRGTNNTNDVVMNCLVGMGLKKKSAFLARQLIADL